MIGQISGARRRSERTLPRRPGKPPPRCASVPVAPERELPARSLPRVPAPRRPPGPPLRESRGWAPSADDRPARPLGLSCVLAGSPHSFSSSPL